MKHEAMIAGILFKDGAIPWSLPNDLPPAITTKDNLRYFYKLLEILPFRQRDYKAESSSSMYVDLSCLLLVY